MRTFDFSPLFRSTIGFDHLSRLMDTAAKMDDGGNGYPPYNIEKLGEDRYRISMAVAGFGEEDLEITAVENTLIIRGRSQGDEEGGTFLYRGIAGRAFERRFQLAEHIRVQGATLVNGLLHVELVREVPEAQKPRSIKITAAPQPAQIDAKAA